MHAATLVAQYKQNNEAGFARALHFSAYTLQLTEAHVNAVPAKHHQQAASYDLEKS